MFKKIFSVLLLLIIGAIGLGYFYYTENSKPVSQDTTPMVFEVPEGCSVDQVLTKLETEGFIKNKLISKFLIKNESLDSVKSGKFEINKAMTAVEIFKVITNSDNLIINTYRMTFIEGQWAKDYAKVIAQHTNYSEAEVLAYWNDATVVKALIDQYEVLTPDILNDQARVYLEGYLSPNTYEFYKEATLEDITHVLLDPTEQFYLNHKALFDKNELSIHQIFTLASIVHFEASSLEDQKLVASVFLNRLADSMRLESSVTVCYALYDYKNWTDCENNHLIESPYNTYVTNGLPIGPIANPSFDAIMTVLDPVKSDYYFFIADVYHDGKVYFAKTYDEHLALKAKYLDGGGQ